MARLFTLIIILTALQGCSKKETESKVLTATIATTSASKIETDSTASEALNKEEFADSESELYFIVSVAEGYNYDSLKTIALRTAQILNFKYDTLGRYYHPQKGIIVPENDEDEMWAGQYFFRRIEDNLVSIEMRHAYIDSAIVNNETERAKLAQDTTKMFVFAMMYPKKESADSLANIIKSNYPTAKVIASEIYMGCMH